MKRHYVLRNTIKVNNIFENSYRSFDLRVVFEQEIMGILEKISEIEKEIARTQKNKG